jgi:ribose 5-phosphate isomerase A
LSDLDRYKRQAALAAVDRVASGTVVGLGSGSTAAHAIAEIAARLEEGRLSDVRGIPTSTATEALASRLGIPLVDPGPDDVVAVTIDGADEIAPDLSLIKGGGGAMLRERIVASLAEVFVVVADHTKLVPMLGTGFAVPLEVAPFGVASTLARLASHGEPAIRADGDRPYVTDNGNLVVDLATGPIADPGALDAMLRAVPGVLATGLFVAMADLVIVAGPEGLVTLTAR